jgi:transposase
MLFIGYFEGIDSQRGIAWRCADSRSLSAFLGFNLNERTPDHSSLSRIGVRIPLSVHEEVFAFVLKLADERGLLSNKTVAVDSTYLEANAAMKSIVRRDTGEDWKGYVRGLAEEAGVKIDDDEDLRKFDKTRKNKQVSNED